MARAHRWSGHPGVRSGDELTAGERAADRLRNGMGSWTFVFAALAFLGAWMARSPGKPLATRGDPREDAGSPVTDTVADVQRSPVRYPRAFVRRAASVPRAIPAGEPVTEADLDGLPAAAVRYLRFMNVVGRPRTGSLLAAAHGRFRMRPDGRWMACRAWQLNTAVPVRRLFHMHLRVAPGVGMTGWDTYADGSGQMRGKLFGVLPVASGTGPHFTTSELVTWLNDAVLLAPSMLLDPAVQLGEDRDDDWFRVELTDRGRSVAARVLVDRNGAPRDFWTDDRYADLPGGLERCRWHTPIEGWTVLDGHPVPVGARAVWQLTGGPFTYAELEFDQVVLDPVAVSR